MAAASLLSAALAVLAPCRPQDVLDVEASFATADGVSNDHGRTHTLAEQSSGADDVRAAACRCSGERTGAIWHPSARPPLRHSVPEQIGGA